MKLEIINQKQFDKRPLLDPAFKAEWCTALRSGKYEQGKSRLLQDGKYCCLGVVCAILNRPSEEKIVRNHITTWFDGDSAGLTLDNPVFPVLGTLGHFIGFMIDDATRLSDLNDNFDYSFEQIAEVIELYF